ncbi:MAG: endonuclease/exonuclease/phosphatase family protein [Anditalea sp.]
MKKEIFKQSFYYLLIPVSVFLVIASLLSLIYNLSFWYSKILDFPRLQYLTMALFCLIIFVSLNKKWSFGPILIVFGLLSTVAIQSAFLIPYFYGEKSVLDADPNGEVEINSVGILIANVLITNRRAADFLQLVKQTDPDMILVMEVDEWWVNELSKLKKSYAHSIEYPLNNAYGMALYSKLPLENDQIKFLNQDKVPSFHTKVALTSGKVFIFHGVHPVAPMPSDEYPDNVGEEEVALLKVGKMVARDSLPSIVAGDFNDVSWSRTSRLFEGNGDLNNVRLGRGLFNSFNAKSLVLRWPLDHYFVSKEFSLLELKRLRGFNSDHFPMFCKLVLQDP